MTTVDHYLQAAPEPQRSTLLVVRDRLRELLPDAELTISYGVPTFKVAGVGVAGFAASKRHCSYLPMSGTVLESLADYLDGYAWSKGALRFGVDTPLDEHLLARLVGARLKEIESG